MDTTTILAAHAKWLCGEDEGVRANLSGTDLSLANLSGTNLSRANLSRANLSGANLFRAYLSEVNLFRAHLSGTCLDPDAMPNADTIGFCIKEGFVVGYRTRTAERIDKYRDGRFYSADLFSVSETERHPGLYLWPTLQQARGFSGGNSELIVVRTKPSEVHRAGDKWRCRWFEVLGTALGVEYTPGI